MYDSVKNDLFLPHNAENALLEAQILTVSWGSMPPDSPRKPRLQHEWPLYRLLLHFCHLLWFLLKTLIYYHDRVKIVDHYKHNGHQLFWNWLTSETLPKRGHFRGQDALRPPYMLAPYGRSKVAFGKQTVCNFNITSSSETFWEGWVDYNDWNKIGVPELVGEL